MKISLVC